jgi:hypothetical protein
MCDWSTGTWDDRDCSSKPRSTDGRAIGSSGSSILPCGEVGSEAGEWRLCCSEAEECELSGTGGDMVSESQVLSISSSHTLIQLPKENLAIALSNLL